MYRKAAVCDFSVLRANIRKVEATAMISQKMYSEKKSPAKVTPSVAPA